MHNKKLTYNDTWLLEKAVEHFLREDVGTPLPEPAAKDPVPCRLKIKSPVLLAGLPWFRAVFAKLGASLSAELMTAEGQMFSGPTDLSFELPFHAAVTGERVALNLLQRASAIATHTKKFSEMASPKGIAILDTRKTTPGLRTLEKYAVRAGGGLNHRFSQSDLWMVKDNHKNFFGGITPAIDFARKQMGAYTPLEVEVHNLEELEEITKLNVRHVMLDNFLPEQVRKALEFKKYFATFEVSGGVNLSNLPDYLIPGVDFISIGTLSAFPPPVDLSLEICPES